MIKLREDWGADSASGTEPDRPGFGELACRVAGLREEQVEDGRRVQRQAGGRLGEILRGKGLLTRDQVAQVLRLQARRLAGAKPGRRHLGPFPRETFLSLCMPAYNERANIEDTLDAACAILPEFVTDFEVVVVDDGSRDGTGDLVALYARAEPRVRLVRHEQNRGYGAAVTSGLRAARGDLIAFTDSDGQFSMLDLPRLLDELDGAHMVIGYRHRRADNALRCLNARAWNWLVGLVLGVRVRDLDCAFKVFRREVVDRLRLTATGAAINAEIMAQCARDRWCIRETPVMHYPRYHGAPTGARPAVILRAFRELARLWRYRVSAAAPRDVRPAAPSTTWGRT